MFTEDNKESSQSIDLTPLEELLGYPQTSSLTRFPFGEDKSIDAMEDKSFKPDQDNMEPPHPPPSIEEKRQKGRIRSRISRERRKAYVQRLEGRIDQLEKENSRLQNIIINFHSEKYGKADPNSKAFIQEIQEIRDKTIKNFWDEDTMEKKKQPTIGVGENYENNCKQALEKHKKFLDSIFEMIINHPYCLTRYRYWKDLKSEYTTDFDHIKKLRKLNKYQISDFMKENNLTPLDEYVASFDPSKRQFDFIKTVVLKKELEVKKKFESAIKHLLEAKLIIQRSNLEICTFIGFFLSAGVFTDEQILQSNIKHGFFQKEQAFKNIWNIQVKPNRYCVDMAEDEVYGKYARKYLKKADRIKYFQYSDFELPDDVN